MPDSRLLRLPSHRPEQRLQIFDERLEAGEIHLLLAVAEGFGRVGVHFDEQTIRAHRHGALAKRADEVDKPGKGYVDEFTPDGALVGHVAKQGGKNAPLNAPWGLAMAPQGFGVFAGDLLVGNFGNGRISAYEQRGSKWVYRGQLRAGDGTIIVTPGLWGMAFGNGAAAGPVTSLYFAAGPNDEAAGAFGVITANG